MKIRLLLTAFMAMFLIGTQAQITTVGIVGSATPGGWEMDTDMTQDPADTSIWTINIDLIDGAVKFRANDDWPINWGSSDFPVGIGVQDGPDIQVFAGNYDVTLNTTTGEYSLLINSPIGILGDATPMGWANDANMYYSEAEGLYFITLDLIVGAAKFRKDDLWTVNWGSSDFPSGIGVQDGDDIEVSAAGTYYITLDTSSGEYNFEEQVSYGAIGLVGTATPGGWDEDTFLDRDANDPNVWSVFVELTDGPAKFRADTSWTTNWGSTEFPIGTGVQDGDEIPVVAGYYRVDFNSETGDYSFTEIGNYSSIGIIGPATPGGWDEETPMFQDESDPSIWTLALEMTDGEAKFRANNDWPINWGGSEFPIGVAVQDGAEIPVEAGEYNITFNTLTGEYNFEAFVVYDQVSIVGEAGPFGDWPEADDMGARDTYMNNDAEDNNLWTLSSVTLSDAADQGGIKFRADTDWTVNWGAADFPSGIGTQDGDNILCTAGTYSVSFNSATGEYLFSDPNGTEEILAPTAVKIYPNPASQQITVDLTELNVSGEAVLKVFNMQGSLMRKVNLQLANTLYLDVSEFNTGNYLMNISNGEFTVGKRFTVVK